MSLENQNESPEKNSTVVQIEKIFSDPSQFNWQDNVHNWPSHAQLENLPDKFQATFFSGGKSFVLLRNREQYLSLPTELLLQAVTTITNTAELTAVGYQQIANVDLPNYGINGVNLDDVADTLVDLRP